MIHAQKLRNFTEMKTRETKYLASTYFQLNLCQIISVIFKLSTALYDLELNVEQIIPCSQ